MRAYGFDAVYYPVYPDLGEIRECGCKTAAGRRDGRSDARATQKAHKKNLARRRYKKMERANGKALCVQE